ncbi:MAG TPA: hypothetical protein VGT78_12910 [Rhizomicrobium sp.]|nr:hypothetical protein [Rhizomicrobium sp.]
MTAIVCTPEEIPAERRAEHGERLKTVVLAKMQSTQGAPTGFTMTYRAEDFLELAKWVDLERLCCPFMEFHLRAADKSVTLEMSGPEGSADYLLSLVSPPG